MSLVIEDPDPRKSSTAPTRALNQLEEARKEFERQEKEKEAKGTFGFFARKKKKAVDKKAWETYQESKGNDGWYGEDGDSNRGVLFDVDAIRAELAKEHVEVRELQSTLPPMRLERASFESDDMEIRELESTLPPMKLNLNSPTRSPHHQDQTYDQQKATMSTPRALNLTFQPRRYLHMSFQAGEYLPTRLHPHLEYSSPYLHPGDEVQMPLDTAYHSPARSSTSFTKPRGLSPAWSPPPIAEPTDRAATLQRPELKSSNTLPVMSMNLEHNAWADDEDEFREREMEMTLLRLGL